MAAEYVMAGGNRQVILCERGVRTFSDHSRNTLDLRRAARSRSSRTCRSSSIRATAPATRDYVPAMALAALAAGADGLLIEVHPRPDKAMSDGAQSLTSEQFAALMQRVRKIAHAMDRDL